MNHRSVTMDCNFSIGWMTVSGHQSLIDLFPWSSWQNTKRTSKMSSLLNDDTTSLAASSSYASVDHPFSLSLPAHFLLGSLFQRCSLLFLLPAWRDMHATSSNTSMSDHRRLEPCSTLRLLGVYLILLWCSGIWLNGKIIWIFIYNRKLRRSSSHVLILGLIVADIVPLIFEMPISILSTMSCRSVPSISHVEQIKHCYRF